MLFCVCEFKSHQCEYVYAVAKKSMCNSLPLACINFLSYECLLQKSKCTIKRTRKHKKDSRKCDRRRNETASP